MRRRRRRHRMTLRRWRMRRRPAIRVPADAGESAAHSND
ncbi:hypothetical protein BURMUCF2_B0173 [Burkholderia multivorans CF2]|nr:hypothetical protein BURMUCF2_B0173 [Burkholderia multivorans CF2]